MKKLHFTYDMQIDYSTEVSSCRFTIKCFPQETIRQRIENVSIKISPDTSYQWGKDGFRNRQIWGTCDVPHAQFQFHIDGDALTGLSDYEEDVDADLAMIFAHPYGLNKPGKTIKEFYSDKVKNIDGIPYDKALEIMEILYGEYSYQPGTTNVDTSAEEAFSQGVGVCQDYAHIMIALLHLSGIPARYVTGFIMGEGQSHGWVEFLFQDRWYGIDPTHNRLVNDEYIKIGHGRDAKDCMINRGIMYGGGLHIQTVNVSVLEM